MKRILPIALLFSLLCGCTSTQWNRYLDSGEVAKSWRHFFFSVKQTVKPSRKPSAQDVEYSKKEQWFGDPVRYNP